MKLTLVQERRISSAICRLDFTIISSLFNFFYYAIID